MAGIDYQAMDTVINAGRSKFYKGFMESARIRSFVLFQDQWKTAKTVDTAHRLEWNMRANSGVGTTQELSPFEDPTFSKQSGMLKSFALPSVLTTHTNCIFTERELRTNSDGNVNKLYDILDEAYSMAEEDRASSFESLALNPPNDPAGAKGNFVGLLGMFGRSMTAAGVFVSQPKPAFNGVFYRQGNGTLSSTVYGTNRANAAASRARPLVATHANTMNKTLLETVRDSLRDTTYTFLSELKGDKPAQGMMKIYMDDSFYSEYETMLSDLGVPRTRDYFNTGDVTIKGATCKAVPSFNGHFLRPIIAVNPSEVEFLKVKGVWNKPSPWSPGYNTRAHPHENEFFSKVRSMRTAGFLIHGSFTTGT